MEFRGCVYKGMDICELELKDPTNEQTRCSMCEEDLCNIGLNETNVPLTSWSPREPTTKSDPTTDPVVSTTIETEPPSTTTMLTTEHSASTTKQQPQPTTTVLSTQSTNNPNTTTEKSSTTTESDNSSAVFKVSLIVLFISLLTSM